jgi:hypothetical protein
MRRLTCVLTILAGVLTATAARAERRYPAIDAYLMLRDAEVQMARSAAPAKLSDRATVKVLTRTGYEVAATGDNGMVCVVLRGFAAPTYTPAQYRDLVYDPAVRAPLCFTEAAARTVLPYYELRTRLGLAGRTPDQIAEAVQAAYAKGALPKREAVSFGYMFSAHQHLGPDAGVWRPHMMVFAPDAPQYAVGDTGFDGPLPLVSDDAGTPFAVVVIPVDETLWVKHPGLASK